MLTLNGLSAREDQQHFIDEYWQRKPCFFKAALNEFEDFISPDELAGLACDSEFNSRIVTGPEKKVEFGPFTEARLQAFETSDSTLLVQAVELCVPELTALRDAFQFIPRWRFDDVMVSFATPNGGVGPHFDHYDVFLVQGEGRREWQVGQCCDEHTETDNTSGQRVLTDFQQTASYTLEAGDILYIPPGVAHWGVSLSNSICYSIGFRAPSGKELATEWSHSLPDAGARFKDPDKGYPSASGAQISAAAIEQARLMLTELLSDPSAIADALGVFQSDNPTIGELSVPRWSDIEHALDSGAELTRVPGARSFYYCDATLAKVYFNGYALNAGKAAIEWLEMLCSAELLNNADIRSHCAHKDDRIDGQHKALLLLAIQHQVYEF